jgi:hypothetical protein
VTRATSDEKMTIQFNCPYCDAVIGFDDKYCGKRAQCTSCGERFIIPSKSFEKAKKVKLKKEEIAEPIGGFYRAVFVDNWKVFNFKFQSNITGIVLITAIVCFKFIVAKMNYSFTIQGPWLSFNLYFPFGWTLWAAAWGLLFWYYREMIYSTAFDEDNLPKATLGGFFSFYEFIWKIIQSLYYIFAILLVTGLPYIFIALIFRVTGFESPVLSYLLLFAALFLLPMAILNVSVGRDLTLLRPDYLVVPIFRALRPYFVTVLLLAAAGLLQLQAKQFSGQPPTEAAGHLALNIVAQFLVLIAMRSIGLFARHYGCHLSW